MKTISKKPLNISTIVNHDSYSNSERFIYREPDFPLINILNSGISPDLKLSRYELKEIEQEYEQYYE